jgi:hypothetical protein
MIEHHQGQPAGIAVTRADRIAAPRRDATHRPESFKAFLEPLNAQKVRSIKVFFMVNSRQTKLFRHFPEMGRG